MQAECDILLNDLLAKWHRWCAGFKPIKGYAEESEEGGRVVDTSSDWALDDVVHRNTMQAFDAAAGDIPQPWRTALSFQARNLATGRYVWTSPRLPVDPIERSVLLLEARNKLLIELPKRGVLM